MTWRGGGVCLRRTELPGITEERVFGSLLLFSDVNNLSVWFICCIADIDPEYIVY